MNGPRTLALAAWLLAAPIPGTQAIAAQREPAATPASASAPAPSAWASAPAPRTVAVEHDAHVDSLLTRALALMGGVVPGSDSLVAWDL